MKKKYKTIFIIILLFSLILTKDILFSLQDVTPIINEVYNLNVQNQLNDYQKLLNTNKLNNVNQNFIISRVSYRNINDFWHYVTINKGSNFNIIEHNVVLNEEGLIGTINKVSKYSSQVMLITNPKINISVKIGNSYGILSAKNNKLYVKNITENANIKVGDKVYTSGLTKVPENILVGIISKVEKDELGLEQILELDAAVKLHDINYVAVLGDKE